jgi:hypothetical protein
VDLSNEIEMHIDEIVLEGLGEVDPAALRNAVQSELARLLSKTRTIGSRLAANQTAMLSTSMTLAPGADATAIGTQIARSIAGGLR